MVETGDATGLDDSHRYRSPLVRGIARAEVEPVGMPIAARIGTPAFLAVAALAAACGGSPQTGLPPGFTGFSDDVARSSAHFRYHAHASDAAPCDGTLDALERNFAAITGALALEWPAGDRVDYYKFASPDQLTAAGVCPFAGAACSANGVVFAAELVNEHELVHAYLARAGRPPVFVQEGIAVVLSCDSTQFSSDARAAAGMIDAAALLSWSSDAASTVPLYAAAAGLVRDLRDRFGAGAFLDYYRQAVRGDLAAVNARFSAAFGAGLDAALAQARTDRSPSTDFCNNVYACAGAPLALDGTPVSVEAGCGVSTSYATFALSADTHLALSLRGGGTAQILSCDGRAGAPTAVKVGRSAGGGGGTLLADLAPGSYAVRDEGTPVVSAGTLALATTQPGWFGAGCNDASPPFPFDESPNELTLAVPPGSGDWFVLFTVPEGSTLYVAVAGSAAAAPVSLCPSCAALGGAGDTCLVAASDNMSLPANGTYVASLAAGSDVAPADFAALEIVRVPPRPAP